MIMKFLLRAHMRRPSLVESEHLQESSPLLFIAPIVLHIAQELSVQIIFARVRPNAAECFTLGYKLFFFLEFDYELLLDLKLGSDVCYL